MKRRKNPRYRPRPESHTGPVDLYGGAGILATSWVHQAVLSPPLRELPPWITAPLSTAQAHFLRAARNQQARATAGHVSIAGRYASVITLRKLRERGLITTAGVHLTDAGLEALEYHCLF